MMQSTNNFTTSILFSKEDVRALEYKHRLPPTSIGVRRVRPSNKAVLKELRRQNRERKKKNKLKNNEQNNDECGESKACSSDGDGLLCDQKTEEQSDRLHNSEDGKNQSKITRGQQVGEQENQGGEQESIDKIAHHLQAKGNYHQLNINPKLIQEEIDELKNEDRRAYNNLPVVLSPPMTHQAFKKNLICNQYTKNDEKNVAPTCNIVLLDDDLSRRWANYIHKNIEVAEKLRNEEEMRSLVYTLVPEVWTRLRPCAKTLSSATFNGTAIQSDEKNNENKDNNCLQNIETKNNTKGSNESIMCRNIRDVHGSNPSSSWYNTTYEAVYDCLYNQFPNIHVSCGAKFGCDYLLYDGSRMERHAFAGLRVICAKQHGSTDDHDLPQLSPYDIAGYVRVLNTAGKLALIALAVMTENETSKKDELHVAIVDLALEKVITETSRKFKKGRQLARKEVGLHLDKKSRTH